MLHESHISKAYKSISYLIRRATRRPVVNSDTVLIRRLFTETLLMSDDVPADE